MRFFVILFFVLATTGASADITICNTYESGPEMANLAETCDLLGSDPDVGKPLLSPEECQGLLTIMGATWYSAVRQEIDLSTQIREALRALENVARAALPTQPPGPTPTATSTTTATATSTVEP